MIRRPPRSTRTDTLCPYTTLFRAAYRMSLPLQSLRVLDLTRALAGPFCTMILGDLGADVVKVEPTGEGEMIRAWGPFDRDISVYYLSVNRNKRSLTANFRRSEESRVGKACDSTGRSRWGPYHSKK